MSTLLLLWWKACKREMDKLVLSDRVTNQGEPTPILVSSPFLVRPLSGHIKAQQMSSLDSETLIYVKHGIFVIFRSNLNGFWCLCHGIGVGASLLKVHQPLHGLIVTSPQEVGMSPHVLTTYPVLPR